MLLSRVRCLLLVAFLLMLGAQVRALAQHDEHGEETPTAIAVPSITTGAPDAIVHAGGSIQDAVDAARAGDVIHVEPGTYTEAILVETSRLTIIGLTGETGEGVVVENPGGAINGIEVTVAGEGFVLSGVTVRGFDKNGVLLSEVVGFRLAEVIAEENGEYGFFAVFSFYGVIERSTVRGHPDSGIYVGQSAEIEVRESTAFENVTGILIENAVTIRVVDSETYGNRAGIEVMLLPGRQVAASADVVVTGNRVYANNHPAFPTAEGLAADMPTGLGILILGADLVTVSENTVTDNGLVGIAVVSLRSMETLGTPAAALERIEPDPDDVHVVANTLSGNGSASGAAFIPLGDLVWDGFGVNNCWQDNQFATSVPAELPSCNDLAG